MLFDIPYWAEDEKGLKVFNRDCIFINQFIQGFSRIESPKQWTRAVAFLRKAFRSIKRCKGDKDAKFAFTVNTSGEYEFQSDACRLRPFLQKLFPNLEYDGYVSSGHMATYYFSKKAV